MIIISLLGLILLGLTANYLIRTTKVVSIMLSAQREYMIDYHKSLEFYYQFQSHPDSVQLIHRAQVTLEAANLMLEPFSDIDHIFELSKDSAINLIVARYQRALVAIDSEDAAKTAQLQHKNATLLYKRIRLIHSLAPTALEESSSATSRSKGYAAEILSHFYAVEADIESYNNDNRIHGLLADMANNEAVYQEDVQTISDKITGAFGLVIGFLVILIATLIWFISKAITSMVSSPVHVIEKNLQAMAMGDLSGQAAYESEDEVGQLVKSYHQMQANLLDQVEQAKRVASGNFDVQLKPRSETDSMSLALNEMTQSLKIADEKNKAENWVKTRQNMLTNELRGDLDLHSLGQKATGFICKHLDALTGVLFSLNDDKEFTFSGGFAIVTRLVKDRTFKTGEGLIGQVAKSRHRIIIDDLPDDHLSIYSGLGDSKPRYLMVVPCIFNDQVYGVIELGSLKAFTTVQEELLDKITEAIAIAISTAQSRTELESLLTRQQKMTDELQVQQEELRQTNEEMQVQQEELRQANEELEAQTRELEESKASLQAQQEELRVTNEELAERTRAIENQRDSIRKKNEALENARKEIEKKASDLEQASRYKSEFMANMSHELRTPLNSILVLSQILGQNKPENLNEKQIKSAQTIHSSGENLLALINELLDLSKIESGRIELHPEYIEIQPFINELYSSFHAVTEEKGLDFRIDNQLDDSANIESDALRLGQIMRNLISNAIKFTEKGHVIFTISSLIKVPDHLDSETDYISFQVADSGIGIPKEKLEMVFDAFMQADGTTTRKFGGTGLGLAIFRNFSRLMGGDIILESHEGQGSVFRLVLPVRMSSNRKAEFSSQPSPALAPQYTKTSNPGEASAIPSPAEAEEETADENQAEPSIHDDRKHINQGDTFLLIIEDDPAFSQVLYDLAHEKHFKCIIAPNGETGLHYADYYGPSAIILDIGLPGIDGWEVMSRLKENSNTRHIPVHFMSASDRSLEAMKKGAIGFLKKPVSVEQVNSALDNIEGLISKPVKKVLVVEDDEGLQESISTLLEEDNIMIESIQSGQSAIDILSEESYDCMILDLGLNDMNGHELLKQLQKENIAQSMPVIIYTGKELSREEEEKLQAYSDRIIIKGIKSPERLLAETTLFLHQVESSLPEEKQQMLRTVHGSSDVMKDKTILIVDDDMRNVFALTSLLEDMGMKIIVGKDGLEGIDKLKNHTVDLILMDIMMPKMNGYEAMESIRKDGQYRQLPIIALTAKAMPGDREKCIAAGANDYLTKPIDSEKLISMLRVWLYQ